MQGARWVGLSPQLPGVGNYLNAGVGNYLNAPLIW
jgi:hypothetical protein